MVYCAAFGRGKVPSSVGIQSAAAVGEANYKSSSGTVYVTVSGLVALHDYDAYCYVESSSGAGSTYAQIIATLTPFRTACCQTVAFTNAPASVYGDVATYGSSASASASYLFKYQLGAQPSTGSVVVTPRITFSGTGTAPGVRVTATPASTSFASTATILEGSFFLTYLAYTTATYTIKLSVVGVKGWEFTQNVSTIVDVLSVGQMPSVPTLSLAQFGSSGSFVTVSFTADTNRAGITDQAWKNWVYIL